MVPKPDRLASPEPEPQAAAETIDTRPQEVDISAYGGDTLTIQITAPDTLVAGMDWNAQVRKDRNPTTPVDATFLITPPTGAGVPAAVVLSAVDTARLSGAGAIRRVVNPTTGATQQSQTYTGVWDCQISDPTNPDPVITLVQGTITLDADVTRLP
jgi:hypothetical protein